MYPPQDDATVVNVISEGWYFWTYKPWLDDLSYHNCDMLLAGIYRRRQSDWWLHICAYWRLLSGYYDGVWNALEVVLSGPLI